MNKKHFLLFALTIFIVCLASVALMSLYVYSLIKYHWLMSLTVVFFISVACIEFYKQSRIKYWEMDKTLLSIAIIGASVATVLSSFLFIGAVYVVTILAVSYKNISIALYREDPASLGQKYQ